MNLDAELSISPELFDNEAETALYNAYTKVTAKSYDDYETHLEALFSLKPELDTFFDKVMVNAEDEKIKTNRKNLVSSVYKSFKTIADIKEISI